MVILFSFFILISLLGIISSLNWRIVFDDEALNIEQFSDISNDLNIFSFGRIIYCNEEYIILNSFTPYGQYDGLMLLKIEYICKIETKNKYVKKMDKLISYLNEEVQEKYDFNTDPKNELLKFAYEKKYVTTIELLDSSCDDVIGYINSINKDNITIKCVDEYGCDDGFSNILYNDISSIRFNSADERIIDLIYKLNAQEKL